MIANDNALEVAIQNLQAVENALDALRTEMQETNSALFRIVSQTYIRRIHALQADIFALPVASNTSRRPTRTPG